MGNWAGWHSAIPLFPTGIRELQFQLTSLQQGHATKCTIFARMVSTAPTGKLNIDRHPDLVVKIKFNLNHPGYSRKIAPYTISQLE